MYAQLDCTQLLQLKSEDTLVLTVNNRFARRILSELQRSLSGAHKAIAVPDIMPLSAWLRQANDELSFYDAYGPASYLLDGFSSLHVWEQIIYAHEQEDAWLIDVPQAAKLAADADQLIDEWSLPIEQAEHTTDLTHFLAWRAAYKDYLLRYDLDDSNRAAERVVQALEQKGYEPRWQQVVLVGFHELSVRLQRLVRALQQQGKAIYVYEDQLQAEADCERVLAPTPEAEWRLAAQWAAQQLQTNSTGNYAIVAFDLQNQVHFAHRILAHELAPHTEQDTGFNWNIAVGRPLSQWPLVRAALAWLQALAECQQGQVRCSSLGQALLSGYCVAEQSEQNQRVRLDVRWRHKQQEVLSCDQVDEALASCPQLAQAWGAARAVFADSEQTLTPAQWVPLLRSALQALGFPGEQSLDSHAYQTMQAFEQRLSLFARLAPVFGTLSWAQLMRLLRRYLKETIFQPQREVGTRLDVLGVLEAEGGRWDGVWVLGVTDEVLPAVPKPNPLLPYQMLRQAQAPRSTPERELEWAHYVCASLRQAAPQLIFSYAEQDNGRLLRPSSLIQLIPSRQAADPLTAELEPAVSLARLLDEQAPPVQADELVFGGSGLLDKQARNPLWAFVQHRLHAKALKPYEDTGVMRLWRGNVLHHALELFWLGLEDRNLQALQQAFALRQVEERLKQAIAKAAEQHLASAPAVISQLEQERAYQVLWRWLQLEQKRPTFQVRAIEQDHQLKGLNTTLRIDRIDELEDGRYLLIDYKTGKAYSSKYDKEWLRSRPINLQLPIYMAILAEQEHSVAGLSLAFLDYAPALVGFSDDDSLTKTNEKKLAELYGDWSGLAQHLQQQVLSMRDEFLQGVARNEYEDLKDLLYCEVLPFLRLETEQELGEEE